MIVISNDGAQMIFSDDGDIPAHRLSGDWRGQKSDLWDGGHCEPFVAVWPGQPLDAPICPTDVLPTGVALTVEDGVSRLPAILSGVGDQSRAIVHHSLGGRFALRSGKWKAIFAPGSGGGFSEPSKLNLFASGSGKAHANPVCDKENPRGRLCVVESYPYGTNDLWAAEPAVVAEMYLRLQDICADESSGLPFGVPL